MKVELSQIDDHTIEISDTGGAMPGMRLDVEPQHITHLSNNHGFIGFTITKAEIVIDPYSRADRKTTGKLLKILSTSGSPEVAARAMAILEELKGD